jgi:CheY-like chemotaxis protein
VPEGKMNQKSILIVEDESDQRIPLVGDLTDRHFKVADAANGLEALEKARALGDELDVVLLDMDIKDPKLNGGQVGLAILASRPDYPPEFLVASARGDRVYYRLAIELDVAAYLEKPVSLEEYARHIRALALRRGLSLARPQATQKIKEIATQSRSLTEAVVRFCQDILAPELESCLGAKFLILFNGENGTQVCATDAGLLEGPNLTYKMIQALALGEGDRAEPFILNSSHLDSIDEPASGQILNKLDKAAFIPLSVRDLRLSLGILQASKSEEVPLPEDAKELCKVLAQYLKPAVLDHMLTILTQWTELESKRKTILINTAQFCLSVGQEQLDILQIHNGREAEQPGTSMLQKLRSHP